ncbi:hypothetical protein ACFLZJ_00910 [Nanoarchaeota archaeon]
MKEKRGQVTIFIIIAVILIALVAIAFIYIPGIRPDFGEETKTPDSFIENCLEEKIEDTVDILSLQGGSVDPEFFILYQNNKVEYLCYTNEYYKPCVLQQPMLKTHVEEEIKIEILEEVGACFNALKNNYEEQGYGVSMTPGETNVELLPERLVTTFGYSVTLSKESTDEYNNFDVVLNNDLYGLVSIANSILQFEMAVGDADQNLYMDLYSDLKTEKWTESDGTAIYTLTDRDTENKFIFASRSIVWPAGLGDVDDLQDPEDIPGAGTN